MEPKIRLKGFSGEWGEKIISQVAPLQRGFDLPTHCVIDGNVPVAYSNGVLRYHNQGKCIAPAVVTGRSGTIGKFTYIESGKYWPHNTSLWVTNFFGNNPLFVYYLFHTMHFENYSSGSGVPTLNRNDIHSLRVNIPQQNEQKAIGAYFQHLDTLIQSTTKKIESLKQVKAASMQSMFPQDGETTPRVRFKGFEGEWSSSFLCSLFAERCEYDVTAEMLSVSQSQGIIKASDNGRFDNSNSDKSKYKLVKVNDIAYNSMRMWQGACGCSPYEGIVSPAYTVVTPKDNVHSKFFYYMFKTNQMLKIFRLNSQGLTSDTWNLKYPAFSKLQICYPTSIEEQQKIADYFTNLDNQITLQTQRLEKLKQIKSACLDNMFV